MSLEFLSRLQKELSITGSAMYESVLAIAERVNRKIHILRLHGQAVSLLTQIETAQGDLGRRVAAALPDRSSATRNMLPSASDLERMLNHAADRIRHLKQNLVQVDAHIRELKLEAIREDLLTLQRDLSCRSAGIERVSVSSDARAAGKCCSELALPQSVRLVTILRGPFLIPPSETFVFRPDDIVIFIGLRTDLEQAAAWFSPARKAKPA